MRAREKLTAVCRELADLRQRHRAALRNAIERIGERDEVRRLLMDDLQALARDRTHYDRFLELHVIEAENDVRQAIGLPVLPFTGETPNVARLRAKLRF